MPIPLYDAAIPVFIKGLGLLDTLLDKAAAFAAEREIDPAELLQGALSPDMKSLAGQVQLATDTAKGSAGRMGGPPPPAMPDDEVTIADLKARVAKTIAYLKTVDPAVVAAAEDRMVTLPIAQVPPLTAQAHVLGFALPNFLFHVVTAYDILRHKGLPVGKPDYIRPFLV